MENEKTKEQENNLPTPTAKQAEVFEKLKTGLAEGLVIKYARETGDDIPHLVFIGNSEKISTFQNIKLYTAISGLHGTQIAKEAIADFILKMTNGEIIKTVTEEECEDLEGLKTFASSIDTCVFISEARVIAAETEEMENLPDSLEDLFVKFKNHKKRDVVSIEIQHKTLGRRAIFIEKIYENSNREGNFVISDEICQDSGFIPFDEDDVCMFKEG